MTTISNELADPAKPSSPDEAPYVRPRRRILTRTRAFVLIGLLLVVFHKPIFRGIYTGLVSHDAIEGIGYVVIVNGDRESFDCAADVLSENVASTVLVIERLQPRVVQLGIVPSMGKVAQDELASRGCSIRSIRVIPTPASTNWQVVRELDNYLQANDAEARVAIVCPEIQSRYFRHVINHTLEPARADRLRLRTFAFRGFGADTWWRNRLAVARIGMAYLRLTYVTCHGEGSFDTDNWSPDRFEESLGRPMHEQLARQ
jgi:hypothetical protein